ncbi:hypothetical protein P389DRAFT_169874 [Cystobasidium minutum MCA 4210]|uniref:uncharacterized protein n=1 Tax=Cystobasidium minutum MCA 4210 TaxID=1397322 RepID=UPI0034CE2E1F|eukprot:jgi/Rhomi1/169874/fgenesh1_kg.3_\
MENKVEDFVAGIEATFGQLARSPEELSGFLRAAESFYLDFIGASKPSTSTEATKSDTSELPFWRYLIFYTTLALDHAATASNAEAYSEDGEDDETSKAVASELSSCWPFLSVLVTQQYNALAHPSQLDLPLSSQSFMHGSLPEQGTSAEASSSASKADTALQTYNNHTTSPRPTMPRHPSVMRAVEPVTPPIDTAGEDDVLAEPNDITFQQPSRHDSTSWNTYLDRASSTGRSLSESTQLTNSSTSTYPSEVIFTPTDVPTQSPFLMKHEQPYPASTPMGTNFYPSAGFETRRTEPTYEYSRSDSTTPTLRNSYPQPSVETQNVLNNTTPRFDNDTQVRNYTNLHAASQRAMKPPRDLPTKLLLADRGDNTAKLVPTPDGKYILDISIGGRKLLVNPERPAEIQYHDTQGAVVTQSLTAPVIHA